MIAPPRHSLCISQSSPNTIRHQGDEGFTEVLRKHYADAEALALEQLVQLKTRLRTASEDDFFRVFCEGISRIAGSQYVIIAQKLDDSPAVGEIGSCFTALCWFWNDGHGVDGFAKKLSYHAYACPCSELRHGKAFLVPSDINQLFPQNPNAAGLPIAMEAYFAIPLEDKTGELGHFALVWSDEGMKSKKLSWPFIETLMRSVEDMVAQHITEGPGLAKDAELMDGKEAEQIVPIRVLSELRSLAPYAKNLSHELRTPMQGIIGMLDVMYSNVQEAAEMGPGEKMMQLIDELKSSIEIIQDSSRRAVDAADNVVQAYALNMGLDDNLRVPRQDNTSTDFTTPNTKRSTSTRPTLSLSRGTKRRSDEDLHPQGHPNKTRHIDKNGPSYQRQSTEIENVVQECRALDGTEQALFSPSMIEIVGHGMQYVDVREMIESVINESLRSGGRPESSVITPTEKGQTIEVQSRMSNGSFRNKTIEWIVDGQVPDYILADERAMAKTISCVFHNALKFTETGRISLIADLCLSSRMLQIAVTDTGSGIPEHFQSQIFKPFAREDQSITRDSEGLGLGLLIAKGLSKKMGGDLHLIRSSINGPRKGSTFELRIPLSPGVQCPSEPSSPNSLASRTAFEEIRYSHDTTSSPANRSVTSSPSSRPNVVQHVVTSVTPPEPESHEPIPQQPLQPQQSIEQNQHITNILLPFHTNHNSALLPPQVSTPARPSPARRSSFHFDRELAKSHPLTFLVAEDNIINRKLLVNMLIKLGYDRETQIYEAYDGADAVAQIQTASQPASPDVERKKGPVDVILMDLWMPRMDGYEATERILNMFRPRPQRRTVTSPARLGTQSKAQTDVDGSLDATAEIQPEAGVLPPTILAVTADATDGAAEKAKKAGMQGFMVKPFRVKDLERLVKEGYMKREAVWRERANNTAIAV